MLKEKVERQDVGIVVARFQIHSLHSAHIELIETVKNRCDKVIILLGLSPLRNTINNPLDFRARKTMIQEKYPIMDVHYLDDCRSDEDWSKNLDVQVKKWTNPGQSIMLFGSRDSFIGHYNGKYPTCELESNTFISGTEIRRQVCNNYSPTIDYRAGMIAATATRYPTAYQTVDVAVLNDNNEILLVRKPAEKQYRFIGGFSDPMSNSLEDDVKREVLEETGIEIGGIEYIGSMKIADWRFVGEKDCIKTAFFVAKYVFGRPEGNDDVCDAKWFNINSFHAKYEMVPEHLPLWTALTQKINK